MDDKLLQRRLSPSQRWRAFSLLPLAHSVPDYYLVRDTAVLFTTYFTSVQWRPISGQWPDFAITRPNDVAGDYKCFT